jgi:hypothetical protein
VAAELAAREAGRLDLSEALELTALVALRERERGRRYALRWLIRWLEEADVTLDEAVTVVGCLSALGGPSHHRALQALQAASETRLAA